MKNIHARYKKLWNINSVEVCLRQYLFRNGDKCLHNTGGWIQCQSKFVPTSNGYNTSISTGVGTSNVIFSDNAIIIIGTITAPAVTWPGYQSTNYYRGGGKLEIYIGTKNILPIPAQKYKSLKFVDLSENNETSTFNEPYSLRVGNANDKTTTTATPTILQAWSGGDIEISIGDNKPYLVIGKMAECANRTGNSSRGDTFGALNASFRTEITEIYLV